MEGILKPNSKTPNPISLSEYEGASEIAKTEGVNVSVYFGELLDSATFLGIGGVHYYAVSKELGLSEYTASQIRSGILDRLDKTDEELGGGKFVETAVSNLILIEGMMNGMDVDLVKALKVNLTEGLAISRAYW